MTSLLFLTANFQGDPGKRLIVRRKSLPALRLLALPISAIVLFGHHGNTAYDETARVPIKGTVTEFVWTNPHSQIYLNVKDSSGKVVNWGVETNSPGLLTRAGWTRRSLKAGDEIHHHRLPCQEWTARRLRRIGRPRHKGHLCRRPRTGLC
jgi:hypothetical protein